MADGSLKVHGIKKLSVFDARVFPFLTTPGGMITVRFKLPETGEPEI